MGTVFCLICQTSAALSKETYVHKYIQAEASVHHYLKPPPVSDAIYSHQNLGVSLPFSDSLYQTRTQLLEMVSPDALRTTMGALGWYIYIKAT
jgi:hypothetical protein